jgi:hypothetical protein
MIIEKESAVVISAAP